MEFVFGNKLFLNRFRVLEKIKNKIDSAKCATFFNRVCLESNMHRLPCIPSNDEDNINDDTSDSSSDTNTLAVEAVPDESHCNVSEEILVSSNITQRKRKN